MATNHRGNDLQSLGAAEPLGNIQKRQRGDVRQGLQPDIALRRIRGAMNPPEQPQAPRQQSNPQLPYAPLRRWVHPQEQGGALNPELSGMSMSEKYAAVKDTTARPSFPKAKASQPVSYPKTPSTYGFKDPITASSPSETPNAQFVNPSQDYDVMGQTRADRNQRALKLGMRQFGESLKIMRRGGAESPVVRELSAPLRNKPNAESTKRIARRFGTPILAEERRNATVNLMAQPNRFRDRSSAPVQTDPRQRWSDTYAEEFNEENARINQRRSLAEEITASGSLSYGRQTTELVRSKKGKALESKVTKALGIKSKDVPRTTRSLKPFVVPTAREDIPAGATLEGALPSESSVSTSYQRITVPLVNKNDRDAVLSSRRAHRKGSETPKPPDIEKPMYDRTTGEKLQNESPDFQRQYSYLEVPRPSLRVDPSERVEGVTRMTRGSRDVRGTYRQGDVEGMTRGGMASEVENTHLAIRNMPGIDVLGRKGLTKNRGLAERAKELLLNMNPDVRTVRGAALEARVLARRGEAATPELRESVEQGQARASRILSNPQLWMRRSGTRQEILRSVPAAWAQGARTEVRRRVVGTAGRRGFTPTLSPEQREKQENLQNMQVYNALTEQGRRLNVEREDPAEIARIRRSLNLSPELPTRSQTSVIEPSLEERKDVEHPVTQFIKDVGFEDENVMRSRAKRKVLRQVSRGVPAEEILQQDKSSKEEVSKAALIQPDLEDVKKAQKKSTSGGKTPTKTDDTKKPAAKKPAAKKKAPVPKVMTAAERRQFLAEKKAKKTK